MPPTLKMETATLQTMVQTPGSMSSLYRLYQVTLKKDLSFCRQRWMHRQRMRKQLDQFTELARQKNRQNIIVFGILCVQ